MSDTEGLGGDELKSLLNLMPMPAILVEPGGGKVVFANDAARPYAEGGGLPLEAAARAARGEDVRGLQTQVSSSNGTLTLMVDAALVPELPGGGSAVVVCFQDVTRVREARAAAERAEEHQRFLARASLVLDESLDPDVTLARIATLAVEGIADWCSVDVVDSDGSLRHVVSAHADPSRIEPTQELRERFPPDPEDMAGAPNVIRTGRSELYPEVTDELLRRNARDENHLAVLRAVGIRSAMMVPMRIPGRVLGAITLVTGQRSFDEDDLRLAEDLARRAAISVETSRLYTERATIARTLQDSLLPPELPVIDGFDLAARYTAAGEGNEVGGDFYDVFQIGPANSSDWAAVIGDVCGKGADAAALTALVRYTIRALATAERQPSEVLELVNEAILRQRSDKRFCTVALVRLALD